MSSATETVRATAIELGFDAVRITTADAPGHNDRVDAWLDAGMHGEMGYLETRRELRAGPLSADGLLPGARSVIMLALSYHFPEPERPTQHPTGVVARYARGVDYHDLFHEKLGEFRRALIAQFPGHVARGLADSAPIRERELAARCGLGWQGKHTNLISLDLGNFFLLGALLTTLELSPDPPLLPGPLGDGHCGTCTRCLAACPTGALVAPTVLDARLCISYLTIELKGPIPLELREKIGDRIFGCDDCLAICPWNDRAQTARESRLAAAQPERAFPNLADFLEFLADDTAFRAKFRGTPLFRTGRARLRRNVCVALGNVGAQSEIPALHAAAQNDPSDLVREHALWAIDEISRRNPL